jgi:N-acetylglucosaminyldiphosphoundecaprenol N-acetyl-beta-D-mannosaminyltransferase
VVADQTSRISTIANVRIDRVALGEAVDAITRQAEAELPMEFVVTPNAHHLVMLQEDGAFRAIYDEAFLSVADGVPLVWAARWLGQPLRGRVNGTDLFEALCERAAANKLRVFLLGGREGAANAAAATLRARHPALQICGMYVPPFGFEADPEESERIVAAINEAKPHLLFVGLGAPKQEYWMYVYRNRLDARVALGIGVSFEFVGGLVSRAPVWMRGIGLEWLHRLISEPQRLWRRYLIGNVAFCRLIVRQRLRRSAVVSTRRAS